MIRFIDLFCGIGGFRLGLERSNNYREPRRQGDSDLQKEHPNPKTTKTQGYFCCIWSCDIDKWARQIYRKNFGEEPEGDITKIPADSIPDHDLLCVGFPCQSFSIAGKRHGFQDTRGTLFFDICRILRAKRPSYCLLENVKGLLSHDNGETFKVILESLDELGYDCQWQVLNSKHFGVPQNRERVFIVGHIRGESRPEVFPIGGCNNENVGCNQINNPKHSYYRLYGLDGVANCFRSANGNKATKVPIGTKIRHLTPTECERLQGFPDNWTAGVSDTQRYKCLGNAVTVNVIEFLGERLVQEVLKL